ncbi:class I SAM-dependent methyltransferase [Kaistella palustris]|uniref:class I SAM-dependent methyltransferase n=1 Tax=Kaistella palustris TaxID=493376 RepID=UPI00146DCCFF|nr:class I SAM-dependent methyltransferase [Kaistella palustris]
MLKRPALINLINDSNIVYEERFKQKYSNFTSLPQIEIKDLNGGNAVEEVESFLLDGSSLITDLQLLATLANRESVQTYFEIGTWRGESVHNVAKFTKDCTTLNLSAKEMEKLGWEKKYAQQHGILSEGNPRIIHLTGNTRNFDFKGLQKKYDLIFIDGDHSYDMVVSDTKNVFAHLLHENSIVVWHDYAYSAQKIRFEVFKGILDGIGAENHRYLYHPKNTMCAVFTKDKLAATVFDALEIPSKIFEINIKQKNF